MTSYTVQYRLSTSTFKKTIKNVVEDGLVDSSQSRYFITQDNHRIEVPVSAEFYFGPDRHAFIEAFRAKLEEDEANNGQAIPGIAHPAHLSNLVV